MDARRKRINRLKKIILSTIAAMILIPLTGCIWLSVELYQLKADNKSLREQLSDKAFQMETVAEDEPETLSESGKVTGDNSTEKAEKVQESAEELQESDKQTTVEKDGSEEQTCKVYLTFDDGPSSNTDRILDILQEYQVKATFFVVGKPQEQFLAQYQRIVAEGHSIGMHSYTHKYGQIYASLPAFRDDLELLRDELYDMTGEICNLYRFPGGSSNNVCSEQEMQQYTAYLKAMGITYFDWNVSSGDAASGGLSRNQIVDRVLGQIDGNSSAVILMHDSADKNSTVEALPEIIERLQNMNGVELLPITEETTPIQHRTN